MRLPATKVWRAFPELDGFDDDRRRRYVLDARRLRRRSRAARFVLLPVGALVWFALLVVFMAWLDYRPPSGARDPVLKATLEVLAPAAWFAALLPVPLLLRDRWLRGAVRDRLSTMRCVECHYTLLGLTPAGRAGDEHVVCPECGRRIDLTPEMLAQLRELGAIAASTPAGPSSP